jgi:hypothetical protein
MRYRVIFGFADFEASLAMFDRSRASCFITSFGDPVDGAPKRREKEKRDGIQPSEPDWYPYWAFARMMFPIAESVADLIYGKKNKRNDGATGKSARRRRTQHDG